MPTIKKCEEHIKELKKLHSQLESFEGIIREYPEEEKSYFHICTRNYSIDLHSLAELYAGVVSLISKNMYETSKQIKALEEGQI